MPSREEPYCRNLLLRAMLPADFKTLKPMLERVELEREQVLVEAGEPIKHLFFLEGGIASVVSELPDTSPTEIGIFGCEGFSGPSAILGSDSASTKTFMQIDGAGAQRIAVEDLRGAAANSASLQAVLLKYIQTMMTQVSHCAVSNANHHMEARLARWLLMCHDRVDGDEIALTHQFMSMMLSAQRSGVTVTLHILEGVGAIRSTRGLVKVIDRIKLEDLAGDAYGVPEAEYRKLIGRFGRPDAN